MKHQPTTPMSDSWISRGSGRGAAAILVSSLTLWGLLGGSAGAADPLAIESGDHRANLSLSTRFRAEGWDAHSTNTDWFTALRTRAGVRYRWRERLTAFVEFQDTRINRLSDEASGAGGLYRTHARGSSRTHSDRFRQVWLELKPSDDLAIRLGRQDIKLGTEVMYPEANWKYLKIARASQRLVGTVGWTHAERSNDAVTVSYDLGDQHLYAFAAKPTTGVFDLNSAYASQNDIAYGGISFTAKRGSWLPNTEVRLFGLAYRDDRDAGDGAFGGAVNDDLDIFTAGVSLIGIHPVASGNVDLLLWGAAQWGDWYGLDHRAYAAALEAGYQLTGVSMKPWFRAGVNLASGDGSGADGDHESFFNMLPTNHLYYGFADRYALANLIDSFVQLKLSPAPKVGVNLFLHHFQLFTSDDGRHFGTGAFNKVPGAGFGIGLAANPRGHRSMGTEVDLVVSYKLHPRVSLLAGYSFMEGHALFSGLADEDVRFAFFQIAARY